MADYLLDTNILSYWYDTASAQNVRVTTRVSRSEKTGPDNRLYISSVYLCSHTR